MSTKYRACLPIDRILEQPFGHPVMLIGLPKQAIVLYNPLTAKRLIAHLLDECTTNTSNTVNDQQVGLL